MKRKLILSIVIVSAVQILSAQSILPLPEKMVKGDGQYTLRELTISAPEELSSAVEIFSDYSEEVLGITAKTVKTKAELTLRTDNSMPHEAYRLSVGPSGVEISGDAAGIYYGLMTLEQLTDQYGRQLPYVEVEDAPRFQWRGLMLDCGRYFYPVEYIKQYIDRMSRYKMNVLHWHLSEDGGWRVEIKSHPELVAASAWRRSTQRTRDISDQDNIPHGGYYTQKQVRDIVEYASCRNVTIVPEIDLPGHTKCILAAHPELNCTGEKVYPEIRWRIWDDVLCIGNEGTLPLIKDILSELIDMFPSEYINIGGDEAPQRHWENCEKCKALMKREGIATPRGLQSYLTAKMDEFVRSKGRKIIGWDEILEGGMLSREAAVMSWRGTAGGIKAAKAGNKVVMAPQTYFYIDYYQSDDTENEPYAIGGFLPVEKVYEYEPFDSQLTPEQCSYILGVQANLWCEYVHSPDHAWYMTFPRALACAEIGWSRDTTKNFGAFYRRMSDVLSAMDRDQIPFRIPEPLGLFSPKTEGGVTSLDLASPVRGSEIYYTIDGSNPQYNGTILTAPVSFPSDSTFKCVVKLPSGRFSAPYKSRTR